MGFLYPRSHTPGSTTLAPNTPTRK